VTIEHERLLSWLQLSLTPGLTGSAWRKLLDAFGAPSNVIEQPERALSRVVDASLAAALARGAHRAAAEAALRWALQPQRAILTLDDARYPVLLRETADPPPVLYAGGRLELLQHTALAIVGSRNATAQGMRNADAFARSIAAAGVCVVSGMALGIDAAAHRGALAGHGSTIAVLGNGIDITYPHRNAELLARVFAEGLVLSEFPLATPPLAANFPRRNRIISGLARGCLVVEAALPSGSLITARSAVDMGRDVFAIPGSIHSPLSRGCHYLIKQGAKLVETSADVLEELGLHAQSEPRAHNAPEALSPDARKVMDALGYEPCDIDDLALRTSLPAAQLLALLTELEIDARVSRNANGTYQRLN
jgi:DNA processing protein